MSAYRPLTVVAVMCLVVAACSGSSPASVAPSDTPAASASAGPSASPSPSPSPTPKPTPSPTPTPTPVPTPSAFTLDSTVWWSGYVIHVTDGTYDPLKHVLHVNATFTNTSTIQTDSSTLGNDLKIVWNGQFLTGSVTGGAIPVGATASAQIQLSPPQGFVVADTVLTFGAPDEHQALIPLNGSAATSEQPVTLTAGGVVKMGKFASYTITKALLVPAGCYGYPDKFKFIQLKKNEVSLVLYGTVTNSDTVGYAYIDQGFVVAPDTTSATSITGASWTLAPKQTLRNQGMCFDVAAPGSGSYTLTMHDSHSKTFGKLVIVVP